MKACVGDGVVVSEYTSKIAGMDERINTIWKYFGYYLHQVNLELVACSYLKYSL